MSHSKKYSKDSLTVKMNQLAQEKSKTEKVYNFAAGDPLIPCSPLIIEAAKSALQAKFHSYPPSQGFLELRKAASEWMNRRYQCSFNEGQCLISCGGKMALYLALQSILEPEDEVLIPSPYWVSYPSMVEILGGKPVILPSSEEQNWKIHKKDLEAAVNSRTRCLILNNASNPTGVLYSKKELEDLLQFCASKEILLLSDEVYSEMTYEEPHFVSCGSFPTYKDHVIVLQSCSKNFCMTGWRIGIALGPEKHIQTMNALQTQSITAVPFICQKAAMAALLHADEISLPIQLEMRERRDLFKTTFDALFKTSLSAPSSAFYYFISLKSLSIESENSALFCEKLLKEYNVATVPGIAFGKEGYFRLSFSGSKPDIEQGLHRLAQACRELTL